MHQIPNLADLALGFNITNCGKEFKAKIQGRVTKNYAHIPLSQV